MRKMDGAVLYGVSDDTTNRPTDVLIVPLRFGVIRWPDGKLAQMKTSNIFEWASERAYAYLLSSSLTECSRLLLGQEGERTERGHTLFREAPLTAGH